MFGSLGNIASGVANMAAGAIAGKILGAITGMQKAMIIVNKIPYPVQFNPEKYSFSQSYSNEKVQENSKEVQFSGVKRDDFTVELFFDSYEMGIDVRLHPSFIRLKTLIIPSALIPLGKRPDKVIFAWDPLGTEDAGIIFEGYATNVTQSFTLFKGDGTPVRAKVQLKLKNDSSEPQKIKDLGKLGCRKVSAVQEGERLDLLANRTLFDPKLWREIVKENPEMIRNPRRYPTEAQVGQTLAIPDYYEAEKG